MLTPEELVQRTLTPRILALSLLAQFTCFTGTNVLMLTPEELVQRTLTPRILNLSLLAQFTCSVYLLYWYKRTNTDT
jgi:hypothetical protein